jgi:hypothetical protein
MRPVSTKIHRFGFAHGTRQALRAACAGDDADLDLGLAELGVVSGDDEVAHHGQLAAATQRKTAHGRDHGFADAADGFPVARDEVVFVNVVEIELGHGRDVGPCGKGFFAAGDDDAANGLVGVKGFEGQAQLVHQGAVQGVQGFGAVEGDDADLPAFGADFNVFVGQVLSPV